VRESDLIALLLDAHGEAGATPAVAQSAKPAPLSEADRDAVRREIIADVIEAVQAAPSPVPLEVLADRAVRTIGHDRTVATGWGGAGGFRELLAQSLPHDLRLSDQPPYMVIDTRRHLPAQRAAPLPELPDFGTMPARAQIASQPAPAEPLGRGATNVPMGIDHFDDFRLERSLPAPSSYAATPAHTPVPSHAASPRYAQGEIAEPAHREPPRSPTPRTPSLGTPSLPAAQPKPVAQAPAVPPPPAAAAPMARAKESTSAIQQSIARIHEACQAPPLAPPEYRALFEVMAIEINENNLLGAQTIQNVLRRAQEHGLKLRKDDVRFVMDVVSEADPWFEQGATANLFAGRFRNFVVARCRGQGLKLSADELDLIDAWFVGSGTPTSARAPAAASAPAYTPPSAAPAGQGGGGRTADEFASDEFPRIVRTRLRG
jgi:hypothetical protein